MITKTSIKLNCINSKPGLKDKVLEWTKGNICVNEGWGRGEGAYCRIKVTKINAKLF